MAGEETGKHAARVVVLGAGGLGGNTAFHLARSDIAEMLLVDFDRVETSNLNRQVLYNEADVGDKKVLAAARRLGELNKDLVLEILDKRLGSEAEIAETIAGYDLVVDGIDWPAHDVDHWVNGACFSAGIPYIAMSHFPPFGRMGPLYVPGVTGCLVCQEIAYRREYPLFDAAIEQLRGVGSPTAIVGPVCSIVSSIVALQAIQFLEGEEVPLTLGASLTVDLRTMDMKRELVVQDAGCEVCVEAAVPSRYGP